MSSYGIGNEEEESSIDKEDPSSDLFSAENIYLCGNFFHCWQEQFHRFFHCLIGKYILQTIICSILIVINLAEDSIVSIDLIALVPDKWERFLIADQQQMRRSKQFIECAE